MIKAIRGATTLDEDELVHLGDRVYELMDTIIHKNSLLHDEVVSILFTVTQDIKSGFPATVVRSKIWDVPMLDVQHMHVDGASPCTIRAMVHVEVTSEREIVPIYLHDARSLRPDLAS